MTDAEKKRVVIIEDDPRMIDDLTKALTELGWMVVAIASTMPAAHQLIAELPNLDVRYVFLDGNLSPSAYMGTEGEQLAREIHQLPKTEGELAIQIVGFSAFSGQEGVDIPMSKFGLSQLPRILR